MTDRDADKINAYLWAGAYEQWDELDGDGRIQLGRAKKVANVLLSYDPSLAALSPYGTDAVLKVQTDLKRGFDMLLASKFPDPDQFRQLYAIYGMAIDSAYLMLNLAEALPLAGLMNGLAIIRPLGLSVSAKMVRKHLLELEELLREAEAEKIEEEIKAALGIVIGMVELLVPGIGLIEKGGLTLGELLIANDWGGKTAANKYGKMTLEVIEDIEKLGKQTHFIAKNGARGLIVVGFVFEIQGVRHASKVIEKIKDKMAIAKKEYDDLMKKLATALPALRAAQDQISSQLRSGLDEVNAKVKERDELISKHRYSIIQPFAWKVHDYSRVKELTR